MSPALAVGEEYGIVLQHALATLVALTALQPSSSPLANVRIRNLTFCRMRSQAYHS